MHFSNTTTTPKSEIPHFCVLMFTEKWSSLEVGLAVVGHRCTDYSQQAQVAAVAQVRPSHCRTAVLWNHGSVNTAWMHIWCFLLPMFHLQMWNNLCTITPLSSQWSRYGWCRNATLSPFTRCDRADRFLRNFRSCNVCSKMLHRLHQSVLESTARCWCRSIRVNDSKRLSKLAGSVLETALKPLKQILQRML